MVSKIETVREERIDIGDIRDYYEKYC